MPPHPVKGPLAVVGALPVPGRFGSSFLAQRSGSFFLLTFKTCSWTRFSRSSSGISFSLPLGILQLSTSLLAAAQ